MIIRDQKGQGFMEVIVAFGIMILGIVSILILTSYNLTSADYGEKRLIASNLAREALEVVRNVRDSNWLAGNAWDAGLPINQTESDYRQIVNFTETATSGSYALEGVEQDLETCSACKLYVANTIFSHLDTGTDSGFRRQVKFQDICDDDPIHNDDEYVVKLITENCGINPRVGFVLTSRVIWYAPNGDKKEVSIQDRIFDWR